MMKYFLRLLLIFPVSMVTPVQALDFSVEALFPGKAMINLHGKRMVLKAGEEKQGITLISTDTFAQTAEFEVKGVKQAYDMTRQIGGGYKQVEAREVMIRPDMMGNYMTTGLINGRNVRFLVDTGATAIALSESLAQSLGIDYRDDSRKTRVKTASAIVDAYQVRLDSVSLQSIRLNNVSGIVIANGENREFALLGMSFLGQLDIEQKQNLMLLRQNY